MKKEYNQPDINIFIFIKEDVIKADNSITCGDLTIPGDTVIPF